MRNSRRDPSASCPGGEETPGEAPSSLRGSARGRTQGRPSLSTFKCRCVLCGGSQGPHSHRGVLCLSQWPARREGARGTRPPSPVLGSARERPGPLLGLQPALASVWAQPPAPGSALQPGSAPPRGAQEGQAGVSPSPGWPRLLCRQSLLWGHCHCCRPPTG